MFGTLSVFGRRISGDTVSAGAGLDVQRDTSLLPATFSCFHS
jgi:hypothetical protein